MIEFEYNGEDGVIDAERRVFEWEGDDLLFIEGINAILRQQRHTSASPDEWGDPPMTIRELEPEETVLADLQDFLDEKGATIQKTISKKWSPYVGPEGGVGWENTESGEVLYQEDPPGEIEFVDSDEEFEFEDIDPEDIKEGDSFLAYDKYEEFTYRAEITEVDGDDIRVRDPVFGNEWPTTKETFAGIVLGEIEGGDSREADFESVDVGDVFDPDVDVSQAKAQVLDQLSQKYDPVTVDEVDDVLERWSGWGYHDEEVKGVWQAAAEVTEKGIPEDMQDAPDASEEAVEALKDVMEITRETLREQFGDSVTVRRKFNEDVIKEYAEVEDGEVTINPRALESWTGQEEWSNPPLVVEKEFDIDDIGFSSALFMETDHWDFLELTLVHDDEYTFDENNILANNMEDVEL